MELKIFNTHTHTHTHTRTHKTQANFCAYFNISGSIKTELTINAFINYKNFKLVIKLTPLSDFPMVDFIKYYNRSINWYSFNTVLFGMPICLLML